MKFRGFWGYAALLLIEPVWNRNRCTTSLQGFCRLLIEPVWNRNAETQHRDQREFGELLIEPVWNRNLSKISKNNLVTRSFNRTSMESKPETPLNFAVSASPFNRTSMESKHLREESQFTAIILLIEPVWNRNNTKPKIDKRIVKAFNRTSMESKHV